MSNKYNVFLLPKAREDLLAIFSYIGEEAGDVTAESMMAKFDEAFERISLFPLSCPLGQTEREYRKLLVKKYIAFYKVDEKNRQVVVYRIFHGMMDYDKYL